ncbi:endonuclease/exonuclease/phosphatase family protein [Actinomycetospora sp. C-140]
MERGAGVSSAPDRRRVRGVPWALVLVLAALPWAWFPLRDELGLVGDVVAIVLPLLVAAAAIVAVALIGRRGVLVAVSALLAGTIAVVAPWTPADVGPVRPGAGVTVASANVTAMPSTVPALRAAHADVLAVVENSPPVDAGVAAAYPYRLFTPGEPSVGVYSRFPLRLLQPPGPGFPGMRAAVAAPTPFVLYAMHVPKPWWTGSGGYWTTPAEHHRLVEGLDARVIHEPGPVVVAGDLNSTDRARDYRLLVRSGLTDAMRAEGTGPTSVTMWRALLLRIDHLLVGPGWCGDAPRQFALPDSDHDGITATVGPCAVTPAA